MAQARELPVELRELLDEGMIRPVGEDEFAIDALRHRERTWMGWNSDYYTLEIEGDDDGHALFLINEETEYLGGDIIETSTDPDEIAYWIREMVSGKDE